MASFQAIKPVHAKARSAHPAYPARFPVPDAEVPWARPFLGYDPPLFEHPVLAKFDSSKVEGGWADPPNPEGARRRRGRGARCGAAFVSKSRRGRAPPRREETGSF